MSNNSTTTNLNMKYAAKNASLRNTSIKSVYKVTGPSSQTVNKTSEISKTKTNANVTALNSRTSLINYFTWNNTLFITGLKDTSPANHVSSYSFSPNCFVYT